MKLPFHSRKKGIKLLLGTVILLALLNAVLAFFYFSGYRLDQRSWYEIHMTDDTIYAGHIKKVTNDALVVAQGHILVAYDSQDSSAPSSAHFKVANPDRVYDVQPLSENMGRELELNRSNVRYWQKISDDSPIVKAAQTQ